jgi:predicted alpha/beta hydrolase family esterase
LRWRLALIDAGDAGHINAESGHGDWSQGWRIFEQLRSGIELPPLRRLAPEPRWALAI